MLSTVYILYYLILLISQLPIYWYCLKWNSYHWQSSSQLQSLEKQKKEESLSVSFSYTISNPWTVMIKCGDAVVTLFTMLTSQWLFNVTDCTILWFDVEHNFIIISIILLWGINLWCVCLLKHVWYSDLFIYQYLMFRTPLIIRLFCYWNYFILKSVWFNFIFFHNNGKFWHN